MNLNLILKSLVFLSLLASCRSPMPLDSKKVVESEEKQDSTPKGDLEKNSSPLEEKEGSTSSEVPFPFQKVSSLDDKSEEALNEKFLFPTACKSVTYSDGRDETPGIDESKICIPGKVSLGEDIIFLPGNCRAKTIQHLVEYIPVDGANVDKTLLELDKSCASSSPYSFSFGVITKKKSLEYLGNFKYDSLNLSDLKAQNIISDLKKNWSQLDLRDEWLKSLEVSEIQIPFLNLELFLVFIPKPKDDESETPKGSLVAYQNGKVQVLGCPENSRDVVFFKLEGHFYFHVRNSTCGWGSTDQFIFLYDHKTKTFKLIHEERNEWC